MSANIEQIKAMLEHTGKTNLLQKQKVDLDKERLQLEATVNKEPVSDDLEEAAEEYSKRVSDGHNYRDLTCGFIAGAEWGERNAYKAIMKKADEVRDKRFNTDYEVKFEPAAGFDLGCINVYHEGKLIGQYVKPKEETKLPDRLEEAAIDYADYARKQPKDYAISAIADYDHGCIDGFKAGAEWQAERLLKGSPMPEDTVIFQKGIEEGKRLMMEDAVEGMITCANLNRYILVPKLNESLTYGHKVKIVIVKED